MAIPANDSTWRWDQINSVTERAWSGTIADQIFKSNPSIKKLKANQKTWDGGTFITHGLAYAEGPGGAFEGMMPLDVDEVEQISAAIFHWKHYFVSITIRRSDELKNSGAAALASILNTKLQIARKSMLNHLAQGLFSDGSDPLGITGLRAMVTGSGTTYGNISKTTYDWWRSQIDSTTTKLTIRKMRALMGLCTEDADTPNLLITTQAIYDEFYSLLEPQKRFASESMAKGGFTSILFEGRPLVVDSHCPAGYLYYLNTDYMKWNAHRREDMRFEPFRQPYRQAGRTAFIFWFGNLSGNNCRYQGAFTALEAA